MRRRDGFAVAWLVVVLPLLLVLMGMVLDFGLLLLRSQMLDAATQAAALAATDAWDRDYWRWHGEVKIDPARARSLATAYLARQMPDARVVEVRVDPAGRVSLRTEATVPYFFLRIIHWRQETVASYSTAVRRRGN